MLEAWSATAQLAPAAIALVDIATGRRFTRADVEDAAEAWAQPHREQLTGQIVAIAEPNGVDWLRACIGTLKCGGVIAPLDPGEPLDAQRSTATQIGAAVLVRGGEIVELSSVRRPKRSKGRLIKLTSGSTGAPRALLFTDAEMLADGRHICAGMEIRPDDLNVGVIPWGHSYGLGNLVMPLLLQGTGILFGSAPLPHAIAADIERWKPTVFPAVPALLRALAESSVPPEQLASLRTIISAGAPLSAEVARAFSERFQRRVHSFYGSSETGGISYDRSGESALLGRGVGQPLPGVQLEFGRGGRFVVASDAVFTCRNRRPGRHRMPDIARLDTSGELVLLGRAGRFVKIAGRRLNLAEVEQALKQVPGVHDALVASHAERADALAAAVATDRPGPEIRDALRDRLAPWKIPKKLLTLSAFPLTSRGKTDTQKIRTLLAG